MNQIYEKLVKCADAVKSKIKFQPKVALILGSGLGDYAETMQVKRRWNTLRLKDFRCLPWPDTRKIFIWLCRRCPGCGNAGRVHFYEGYPMQDVVLPVRLMGMLGAKS